MNCKRILSLLVVSCLIIISCSRGSNDDDINNQEEQQIDDNAFTDGSASDEESEEKSTYGLKTGNYWVYKYYRLNKDTDFYEDIDVVDSIIVSGIEIIKGTEFFILKRNVSGNENRTGIVPENGEYTIYRREVSNALFKTEKKILLPIPDDYPEEIKKKIQEDRESAELEENIVHSDNMVSDPYLIDHRYEPLFELYQELKAIKKNIKVPAGDFECSETIRYGIYVSGQQIGERTVTTDYYYNAKGIGLVLLTFSSVSNNIPFLEKRLVRYKVD